MTPVRVYSEPLTPRRHPPGPRGCPAVSQRRLPVCRSARVVSEPTRPSRVAAGRAEPAAGAAELVPPLPTRPDTTRHDTTEQRPRTALIRRQTTAGGERRQRPAEVRIRAALNRHDGPAGLQDAARWMLYGMDAKLPAGCPQAEIVPALELIEVIRRAFAI